MTQMTFAEAEFANKKRKTRREIFLERMEALTSMSSRVSGLLPYLNIGEPQRVQPTESLMGFGKAAEWVQRQTVALLT